MPPHPISLGGADFRGPVRAQMDMAVCQCLGERFGLHDTG